MKKTLLVLLLAMFAVNIHAQIVGESESYRWDEICSIRAMHSKLKCRINVNTGEKMYQIYAETTNRFDNFCLTLGDLSNAIKTVEYLFDFMDTSKSGDIKAVNLADGKILTLKLGSFIGQKELTLLLSDCAGTTDIYYKELKKVLNTLTEIEDKAYGHQR